MLRNNADVRQCSYFELGLSLDRPAKSPKLRLLLNRFDIADSLCCMNLIHRFSQLLRCEVALHL